MYKASLKCVNMSKKKVSATVKFENILNLSLCLCVFWYCKCTYIHRHLMKYQLQ